MDRKISSLADLNAVRDQARSQVDLRTGGKELRITDRKSVV